MYQSSGEIGFLQYFPEFLLKIWIFAQKPDTRAILLKTVLVHVSCIQNTQIRGETTAKVFGKVDTFWTYQQASASLEEARRSSVSLFSQLVQGGA
jgi:hypothetical protein